MAAKAMDIRLDDGRAFKISPSDWIGEGGEGAVYKKGPLAVKIVEDKAALARKEPKLSVFKKIKHPLLATPLALVFDAGGALVGYAMECIEGLPLARCMVPAWRAKNGMGDVQLEALCKSMVEAVLALHGKGAWGGDLNEFNWRVKAGAAVLIDCDSWGCAGHPVSAMMPSIADPKALGDYGPESDWYALAVLFFSLYAGIHPFRGSVDGYGPKDMQARMKAGASLFAVSSRWPASVPGPDALPKGLRPWLEKTLSSSLREAPPSVSWSAQPRARKSVKSSGSIDFPAPFASWAAPGLAKLSDGSYFDMEPKARLTAPSSEAWRWVEPESGAPWWIWQDGSKLKGSVQSGQGSFEAPLATGATVAFWAGEPWAAKEGSWSSFAIRKMGAMGVRAVPCAQGLLGGAQEWLDGCMSCAAMGALALMRPMGPGKGAMALQLKPPCAGARLAWASAQGPFEWVEWAMPDGSRRIDVQTKGRHIAAIDAELDWAVGLGASESLAQAGGEAWIASASGVRKIEGWSATDAPASCSQGALWRVEVGGLSAKAYSVAKLLGAAVT